MLINEVDAVTNDEDLREFVEIFDGGRGFTNLSDMTLVLYDGATEQAYAVYELEGFTTGPNGYFVVGGAGLGASVNLWLPSFSLQNETAAVALYAGMTEQFTVGSPISTQNLLDAVVYGTPDQPIGETLRSLLALDQAVLSEDRYNGAEFESLQRCPNGTGLSRTTTPFAVADATPKQMNRCTVDSSDEFGSCGQIARRIHAVQGSGASSPIDGFAQIVVEGIVTGDFQDSVNQLGGFFLQEEPFHSDNDPTTSEGIFILTNGKGIDVNVGDIVRVQGDVREFFDQTQLINISEMSLCGTSNGLEPVDIRFPLNNAQLWEQHEGMLIRLPQTLYVTDNHNQGRFGEVELSAFSRLLYPTHLAEPGVEAGAIREQNNLFRILLDDGSTLQNPDSIPYLNQAGTLRIGDAVSSVVGVLDYGFNAYRIQPVDSVLISNINERPFAVPDVGGAITIAYVNLMNYFNGDGAGGGFPTELGADTSAEFTRQRTKIVNAIATMNADIVGLSELENDEGPFSAIEDLVMNLNRVMGIGTYDYIDTGQIGSAKTRVALLYKPSAVTPRNGHLTLGSILDIRFNDRFNHPSLAQKFEHRNGPESVTVVVNALVSRTEDCSVLGDIDVGDGQGNCVQTRTNAASALVEWIESFTAQQEVLVLGELNAFAREDPVAAFTQAGYTDMLQIFWGVDAYTNVFVGQTGYLDHLLANQSLHSQITGVAEWHINADEPRAMDYNDSNQPFLYSPDVFRSSDHDPLLIGIRKIEPSGQQTESFINYLPFLMK